MAMFGVIALFSAAVIYIYLRLEIIHPLEKWVYWFCAFMLNSLTFTIAELNLRLITTSKQWLSFITIKTTGLLFHGVGIALFVVVLGSRDMKLGRRWAILLTYPAALLVGDYLLDRTRLEFTHSNLWISTVRFLIIITGTYLFMLLFRSYFKRVR